MPFVGEISGNSHNLLTWDEVALGHCAYPEGKSPPIGTKEFFRVFRQLSIFGAFVPAMQFNQGNKAQFFKS